MSLEYQQEQKMAAEVEQPASPLPIYTYAMVAATVAVAIMQFTSGLEASIETTSFDKPAFVGGEYWRILTGTTVHASILHIAMNSFAFFSFGRIFEMLSNRAHLAIVFVLAALSGAVLSLIFMPFDRSVGASGGILGLIGFLAVYSFKRRRFIAREFRRDLLVNIGFILIFGFVLSNVIDNYAHIGGLVAGAVYGLIQIPTDEYVDPRGASSLSRLVGFAAFALYLGSCLFSALLIRGYA